MVKEITGELQQDVTNNKVDIQTMEDTTRRPRLHCVYLCNLFYFDDY